MRFLGLKLPGRLAAVWAGLLTLSVPGHGASASERYRVLSPAGDAPHPAVLFVSGCSGFVASNGVNLYDERAAELQAAGFIVVFVDYLGRRNLRNCDGHFSHTEIGKDILEAATWIRGQPDVDANRISVIGWSYGGGAVLGALTAMPPEAPIFAKAVMYYPDCRGEVPWSAGVAALMLLGAIDEVTPPVLCDEVVKGVPANRLRTITYPNARHAFDSRGLPERFQNGFATIGYNADAAQASWATVLDFLK